MTHGKPCVNMHASGNVYKREVIPVCRGREEHKGKEKEKGKRKKEREIEGKKKNEKKEKEKEREKKVGVPRIKVCIFYEGYALRGRDSFYFGFFQP